MKRWLSVAIVIIPVLGGTLGMLPVQAAAPTSVVSGAPGLTIRGFLQKYGWTETKTLAELHIVLPSSFTAAPEGYPLGLFWNYVNVLSKDIGLNMRPYLGQLVTVRIITIKQIWGGPNPTDAIIVWHSGRIIGGWLRNGSSPMGSLRRHYFGDLVAMTWEQWLSKEGYVRYQREHSVLPMNTSPRRVIQKYFYAVNHHRLSLAYQLMSYNAQFTLMTPNANRLSDEIYVNGINADPLNVENIDFWHLKSITPSRLYVSKPDQTANWYRSMPTKPYEEVGFRVLFTAKYKKPGAVSNGPGGYEFVLVKETRFSPWRISGFGNG